MNAATHHLLMMIAGFDRLKGWSDSARARGMSQLAKDTGLTREGLYKALSKDSNPSLGTVMKVMKALGLRFRAEAA